MFTTAWRTSPRVLQEHIYHCAGAIEASMKEASMGDAVALVCTGTLCFSHFFAIPLSLMHSMRLCFQFAHIHVGSQPHLELECVSQEVCITEVCVCVCAENKTSSFTLRLTLTLRKTCQLCVFSRLWPLPAPLGCQVGRYDWGSHGRCGMLFSTQGETQHAWRRGHECSDGDMYDEVDERVLTCDGSFPVLPTPLFSIIQYGTLEREERRRVDGRGGAEPHVRTTGANRSTRTTQLPVGPCVERKQCHIRPLPHCSE
ncbi:unspecified product [Leishmania tarentolae]|uniref:Unspecified product n=1 Tax=Leishmania tarentolae TaxID=5689 RepID=A0A640KDU5_LEITA|nr:unspecified product [Leishmania tarentolae]